MDAAPQHISSTIYLRQDWKAFGEGSVSSINEAKLIPKWSCDDWTILHDKQNRQCDKAAFHCFPPLSSEIEIWQSRDPTPAVIMMNLLNDEISCESFFLFERMEALKLSDPSDDRKNDVRWQNSAASFEDADSLRDFGPLNKESVRNINRSEIIPNDLDCSCASMKE